METIKKPHAVCVPLPFRSHINAMLNLAKVLHSKGFHITFVNTELNHQRILAFRGPEGMSDFQFEAIPDGLPPLSDINASHDSFSLLDSVLRTGLLHVRSLIAKLNTSASDAPVSCIVADFDTTSCTLEAAQELGIPQVILWPMSASVWQCYRHPEDIKKCLLQLKGKSEYMDTPVDFIPGIRNLRLKDLGSFFWNGKVEFQNIFDQEAQRALKASAIILNTFDALENEVLEAMETVLPHIYTIGPLNLLEQQIQDTKLRSFGSNLLEEHQDCLKWLDSRLPNSVLYVNFGSSTVITRDQLIEFAWGLANSKHPFLWVIRPDLVM